MTTNDLAAAIEALYDNLDCRVRPQLLKNLNNAIETLRQQHAAEVADLRKRVAALQTEVQEGDRHVNDLIAKNESLAGRIAELEAERDRLNSQLIKACGECERSTKVVAEARRLNTEVRKENQQLTARCEAAEAVIEHVKQRGLIDDSDYQQLLAEWEATGGR